MQDTDLRHSEREWRPSGARASDHMRLQKGKYGCSFLEGPPVVMGHHDTMLLHINTVLILMASFYRVWYKNRAPSHDPSQA